MWYASKQHNFHSDDHAPGLSRGMFRNHMSRRSQDPAVVVAVAVILTVVGTSAFNILPILAAGAAHSLGFSEKQIGSMSSAISIGSGASSLLAGMWVRSVRWPRAAALALGGVFAANALSVLIKDYWLFVLLQGLAGVFGGSLASLGWTILSDRPESARSFGLASTVQVAYQIAALLVGPTLLRVAGLKGMLTMLAVLSGGL
jgi:predicted MFS family arabinose efflux permease